MEPQPSEVGIMRYLWEEIRFNLWPRQKYGIMCVGELKETCLTPRQGHAAGKHLLNDIAVCFGGIGAAPIYPVLRSTELFGTNSSIELRSVRAEVSRYLDPELVPLVNPGDTFELKLDADGCGELTYLEMYFRDAWWF